MSTHNICFHEETRKIPALSSACDFKSHFCKQCGPRSDCSFRSSLIWVHTFWLKKCLIWNCGDILEGL